MARVTRVDSSANKTAVVTGGTRGIGKAIAARLIADGVPCLVTGTSAEAPAHAPAGSRYFGVDLGDRARVRQLAGHLRELRPAILVNNAGINVKGDAAAFPDDEYDRMLEVNLRAPFVLIKAVLPGMLARNWGRIVNITSLWGVTGNPEDAAYCASKFGLDGMTASIAADTARSGVLINSVAPGFICTEAAEAAYTEAELKAVSAQIPVGRLGKPEEVASLVAWLASPENTYMTGQNLLIDGGLTRTAKLATRESAGRK